MFVGCHPLEVILRPGVTRIRPHVALRGVISIPHAMVVFPVPPTLPILFDRTSALLAATSLSVFQTKRSNRLSMINERRCLFTILSRSLLRRSTRCCPVRASIEPSPEGLVVFSHSCDCQVDTTSIGKTKGETRPPREYLSCSGRRERKKCRQRHRRGTVRLSV